MYRIEVEKDARTPNLWSLKAPFRVATGGGVINATRFVSTAAKMGTPLSATRNDNGGITSIEVVKTVQVVTGGTTAAPRVTKNNELKVGEFYCRAVGTISKTITDIDRTNVDYDVITFDAAITNLVAGDILEEAVAAVASAVLLHSVDGFLAGGLDGYNPNVVDLTKPDQRVSMVVSAAEVHAAYMPYHISQSMKDGLKGFNFVN